MEEENAKAHTLGKANKPIMQTIRALNMAGTTVDESFKPHNEITVCKWTLETSGLSVCSFSVLWNVFGPQSRLLEEQTYSMWGYQEWLTSFHLDRLFSLQKWWWWWWSQDCRSKGFLWDSRNCMVSTFWKGCFVFDDSWRSVNRPNTCRSSEAVVQACGTAKSRELPGLLKWQESGIFVCHDNKTLKKIT